MHTKDDFRLLARDLRVRHAADTRVSLLSAVSSLPCFAAASSVAAYMPLGNEPQTADIIQLCREQGKHIGLPAWFSKAKEYRICDYPLGTEMARAQLGIPEPVIKSWIDETTYDLFLVPGILFDRQGTRIGHGKGYYDRILAKRSPTAKLVALAFDWQISEVALPYEPHDIPMDFIITPTQPITRVQ